MYKNKSLARDLSFSFFFVDNFDAKRNYGM